MEENLDGYGNGYSQGQREQSDNTKQKVSKTLPEVDVNETTYIDPDVCSMTYGTLPKRPKARKFISTVD